MPGQLMWIGHLKEVPLGVLVADILDRFDHDPELRYQLISHGLSGTAFPLSRQEVEEEFSQIRKLIHLPTGVVAMQSFRHYLHFLDMLIEKVEGRQEPETLSEEGMRQWNRIQDIRSYWLSQPEYAGAVRKMYESLKKAAELFAGQAVLQLMDKAKGMHPRPAFFGELTNEEYVGHRGAVDSWCYMRGRRQLSRECAGAYEALQAMPQVNDPLGSIFYFSPEQILAGLQVNAGSISSEAFEAMGAKGCQEEIRGPEIAVESVVTTEGGRVTESGLWLPR